MLPLSPTANRQVDCHRDGHAWRATSGTVTKYYHTIVEGDSLTIRSGKGNNDYYYKVSRM